MKSRTKKQENTAHIQGGGKQNSQRKLSLGFAGGSVVKNPSANAGDTRDMGLIPHWDDPLEKEMATHSSILTRKIPWTEESGGLQSMELQRVGHG